ncbi:MAG: hypothetical protein H6835_07605 [Planctomycetes bacterium]|nr:hypothetical protein [Planctomycetota bacterium]
MRLALVHLWKEWRAQRALLLAYTGLVFASLCLMLWMFPKHKLADDYGVQALSWFVAAGVIGVVGFAVPGLVRGEFAPKDDQFVRRLPGALGPAFGGKLLFFVLATLLLPLLGLLLGEVVVDALGGDWNALWQWDWTGETVWWQRPWLFDTCVVALCCTPWIWAIGTWLPGGRMAVLGTVLFGLLLGTLVFAVLRQSPGLEKWLPWLSWLWVVPPSGLLVAAVSWCKGRRGGGPLRSARFGLAMTAALSSPFAVWLGAATWRYRHPDLQQLAKLYVGGVSPSGRFVLVVGAEHEDFAGVPLRIDLATGAAEQLDDLYGAFAAELLQPTPLGMEAEQRYWRMYGGDRATSVLDLETGERTVVDYDWQHRTLHADGALGDAIAVEHRDTSRLCGPGGQRVAIDGDAMTITWPDGNRLRQAWPLQDMSVYRAAGHGLQVMFDDEGMLFDFVHGRKVAVRRLIHAFFVGEALLHDVDGDRAGWLLRIGDGEAAPCEALRGCDVLGLVDDRRVLVVREVRKQQPEARLFVIDPITGEATDVALPPDLPFDSVQPVTPMHRTGSLLERDPDGRIWLLCRGGDRGAWLRFDPANNTLEPPMPLPVDNHWRLRLLSWSGWPKVLVQDRAEIVRYDIHTGQREVLFPRR